MHSTALDIGAIISGKESEVLEELAGRHKYKRWYTNKKEETLKQVINQNVTDLYHKFTVDHEFKARIGLETANSSVDLTDYLDGRADGDVSSFLPRTFTREEKVSIMKQ